MNRLGDSLIVLTFALGGCGSAVEQISPELLRISARDALLEARTAALGWNDDATLRWVEGEGVTPDGYVLPPAGEWRFIYEAPSSAEQLVVTVTSRTLEQVGRPRQSPPGYAIGDAVLEGEWIDSPTALAAARAAGAEALVTRPGAAIAALLVPLRPARWIIRVAAQGQTREWQVDARTGQALP